MTIDGMTNRINEVLSAGKSSAERQRAFRARREAEGFFQVTGIVGGDQVAEVNQLLRILRSNPDLVPVLTFRNVRTGRMVKVPSK